MMTKRDLVVIGAGPAGMAAAAKAAELGLSVTVLDEQQRGGGQIYRDVDRVAGLRGDILGKDYTYGTSLTAGLRHAAINHVSALWSGPSRTGFGSPTPKAGAARRSVPRAYCWQLGRLSGPCPCPAGHCPA